MISITLWDGAGPSPYNQQRIDHLKKHELCVFHGNSIQQIRTNEEWINRAIHKSSKVVLTIPEPVTRDQGFAEMIREFKLQGLHAISVKFTLTPGLKATYEGANTIGDAPLISRYDALFREWGSELKVIPEVEIGEDITFLGPTLMELSYFKPAWMVLSVDGTPDELKIRELKKCFEYLQIRNFSSIDIHFSFDNEHRMMWKLQSGCFFSGPEEVHMDLSNKCTHSCVFCALYAPDALEDWKKKGGGKIDPKVTSFMSAQLPFEKAAEIIESLPHTTLLIQFGGAGDPMIHPRAIDIITLARERAFRVETLTNMDYCTESDLERLTELGGTFPWDMRFIANVSAATPETYKLTRPRQSEKTFEKVIGSLRKLTELRRKNGNSGVHFTLMCVINRLNYHEAALYVKLAKEIGANDVWFKPLEVHHHLHRGLLPQKEIQADYQRSLKEALEVADDLGVKIHDREMMNSVAGV